jgi:hypothetical protein
VLLVAAAVGALSAGLHLGARGTPVLVLLAAVYLALGSLTTASYALFMDLTDPRAGSTLFSAFMGATNLCEAWAVWFTGRLVAAGGATPGSYATAWLAMIAASLLGLAALAFTRRR